MPTVPFKVKAVYEYKSEEADDLSFPNGQIITVTDDEDEDWYTGNYTNAAGEEVEGLFPRNFVQKYEPAIPSRPVRTPKRAPAPEPQPEVAPAEDDAPAPQPPGAFQEAEMDPPFASQPPALAEPPTTSKQETVSMPAELKQAAAAPPPAARSSKPGPPPIAEKPASNSFKDRIAAFNKPAATPVTPFKPGGQPSTGAGFIKKPFVAPPPSKNAYVPPPREPPPQKIYRREEDPSLQHEEEREAPPPAPPPTATDENVEDQPKPTSLKERIALLQKQQLESAQRQADATQKKDKPKKPPRKRPDPSEEAELEPVADAHLDHLPTNDTVVRKSMDLADDDSEDAMPRRQLSQRAPATPPPPARELVSDTNDADDSGAADTEDAQEISTEEDRPRSKGTAVVGHVEPVAAKKDTDVVGEEDGEQEEQEEETEEEEEDPEVRRRRELRERMAKMSGGMGMMGMFGAPARAPSAASRKPKPSGEYQRQEPEQQEETSRAPPVPTMALPGMPNQLPKRNQEPAEESDQEDDTAQPTPQEPTKDRGSTDDYVSQWPKRSSTGRSVSSATQDRSMPPLPPQREARAPPPPPPGARTVPELPQPPIARAAPPLPPPTVRSPEEPKRPDEEHEDEIAAPPTPPQRQFSMPVPTSPIAAPPIPITRPVAPKDLPSSPMTSPQTRAPPPPPPGYPPSRKNTSDSILQHRPQEDSEEEVEEYDGDYDTDIASSAKHKDALKSHNRNSSIDDEVLTDDATKSPRSPPSRAIPPLPSSTAPRDVPPPPPPSAAPRSRKSMDASRAVPPPVPPPKVANDEDYDPYRYSAPPQAISSPSANSAPYAPALASPQEEVDEDDMYGASTQAPRMPPPPLGERSAPPPPNDRAAPAMPMMAGGLAEPQREPPRQSSLEVKRSATTSRRSTDQSRPSGEHGFIASDIDLAQSSFWWTQAGLPPPALQNRPDLMYELESNTSSKRGGRTTISKDVYVLYQDYSQTTINATFDQSDPSHVTLEQSHQRPPPPPRKDQLEAASEKLGSQIASAANNAGTTGSTVGDGSAHGLVGELLRPLSGALRPIGNRTYGALIYANLANASTQQFDEIRAGDIVTFRNAKFSGHKGGLHQKYSLEAGKPDHVGVVLDWDGTKKKIRAWEQRGEEKGKRAKVREESFKVGDLKSGEVRVWRVMPKSYVGWN